jgi:hypothetical protein
MALSGTLKDFALPDIFQLIGMQRKTGLLTLESERETVSVVFEQGMVVHADSTVRRLDDLLGNLLLRQGKLRKEVLEEALAKQKVSMQRLGYILTSQGYIQREDLQAALSEQVQQIVFRVFRWKKGRYHFDPSADADYDRENVAPVSTDHILMEGIRRVDEWPIIEKRIPSLDFVFRPLVPQKQIKVVESTSEGGGLESVFGTPEDSGGDTNHTPTSEVVLNTQEAKIYKLLDGKRSVENIMELTGLGDFDVCRTLFDFIDRNLVAPAERAVASGAVAVAGAGAGVQPKAASRSRSRVRTMDPLAAEEGTDGVGIGVLAAVVLLSAIGLFLSIGAPFRIPGVGSLLTSEAASIEQSRDLARLERVLAALDSFYMAFGSYPNQLEDLVNADPPLLSSEDLVGASGRPFRYQRAPDAIQVQALAPTGEIHLSFSRKASMEAAGPADAHSAARPSASFSRATP